MRLLADRPEKEAVVAIGSTWLAFCVAASLAVPQPPEPTQLGLAALLGAALVLTGFPAASRVRPLSPRSSLTRARRTALSLLAGSALGVVLLGALMALSRVEPALSARFANRRNEPLWRPVALGLESSILEETFFRLFLLSVVTWTLVRLLKRPRWALALGVVVSTLLFGVAHLPAWSAVTQLSPVLTSGVVLLNGLGALLCACLFWRWGLPYAVLSHFAGDVVLQSLAPRLVG